MQQFGLGKRRAHNVHLQKRRQQGRVSRFVARSRRSKKEELTVKSSTISAFIPTEASWSILITYSLTMSGILMSDIKHES